MALSLPIYLRGSVWVLHTRVRGRQVKRSLRTADPRVARLRAIRLLVGLHMAHDPKKILSDNPSLSDFPHLDPAAGVRPEDADVRKYHVRIGNMELKAEGEEDHRRALEALKALREWESEFDDIGRDAPSAAELAARKQAEAAPAPAAAPQPPTAEAGIKNLPTAAQLAAVAAAGKRKPGAPKPPGEPPVTFSELHTMWAVRAREERTVTSYGAAVEEFEAWAGKPYIWEVNEQHITGWQDVLTKKGNTPRTIDKKVDVLKALFNFGKKHRQFAGQNPAAERNLLSKAEKEKNGHKTWALDEVKEIMGSGVFAELARSKPNFHLFLTASLVTGIRSTPLALLRTHDVRRSVPGDTPFIRVVKDKTEAGKRDVPIPLALWTRLKDFLDQHGSFGYPARDDGGGASDEARKDFDELLAALNAKDRGFVIHGLRKAINNALIADHIGIEDRCQFLGHKIKHLNVTVYGPGDERPLRTLDELAQIVLPTQQKLLGLVAFE